MPEEDILPEDFDEKIISLVRHLMAIGVIRKSSYGIVLGNLGEYASELEELRVEVEASKHSVDWYVENARGKAEICLATELDSLVACTVNPVILLTYEMEGRYYPFGGGIVDQVLGSVVAVSGGSQDDDILVARMIMELARKYGNEHMREVHARVNARITDFNEAGHPDDHPDADGRFFTVQ